jgi:predicted transcriptional regulator
MRENTSPPKPTPAELDLLGVLWRTGPADAKLVCQHLQADKPDTNYANVLRQLQLMHAKGLLSRNENHRPHLYAPMQPREVLQTSLVKDMINKVFAGSGKALVLAALHDHVTPQERADIERILHGDKKK